MPVVALPRPDAAATAGGGSPSAGGGVGGIGKVGVPLPLWAGIASAWPRPGFWTGPGSRSLGRRGFGVPAGPGAWRLIAGQLAGPDRAGCGLGVGKPSAAVVALEADRRAVGGVVVGPRKRSGLAGTQEATHAFLPRGRRG